MKPTELRIGNWVYFEGKKTPHKILSILPRTYHTNPISIGGHEDYRPIPLTEDWLKRFGFETESFSGYWSIGRFSLFVGCSEKVNGKWLLSNYINQNRHIVVDYVHQLQNLYHALTGDELKIKEE